MNKEDLQLITKICYLYYNEYEVQSSIAKRTGVTRQMVSRLLQKARNEGIVQIKIRSPIIEKVELESKLEDLYKLSDVIVIQNDSIDKKQLDTKMGIAAAEYFNKSIDSRMKIGVGYGDMLHCMAKYINENIFIATIDYIELIQLVGGLHSNKNSDNSQYLMGLISENITAIKHTIDLPFIVEDKNARAYFLKKTQLKDVHEKYKNMDMAFVEIGNGDQLYKMKETKDSEYLSMLGINYLNNSNYYGEICMNYYNDRGSFVKTDIKDQLIGVDDKALQNCKNLVGVSCGKENHQSVFYALKTGVLNSLIIDEETALYLINEKDK